MELGDPTKPNLRTSEDYHRCSLSLFQMSNMLLRFKGRVLKKLRPNFVLFDPSKLGEGWAKCLKRIFCTRPRTKPLIYWTISEIRDWLAKRTETKQRPFHMCPADLKRMMKRDDMHRSQRDVSNVRQVTSETAISTASTSRRLFLWLFCLCYRWPARWAFALPVNWLCTTYFVVTVGLCCFSAVAEINIFCSTGLLSAVIHCFPGNV